jgi:hypothetical protein
MKYKIGDVVLITRGRKGDFYRSLNGVGIIIRSYDMANAGVKGYKVIVAGKIGETYFVTDNDIKERINEI